MLIDPLYHWSPSPRKKQILKYGLLTGRRPVTNIEFRAPYVCLSTAPSTAWGLTLQGRSWDGEWDLWQIRLVDSDEVHIRPYFGRYVEEVQVYNRIPKSRVWYVASRTA